MAFLSGYLQRPVLAASAVAVASFSSDLQNKFWPNKSLDSSPSLEQSSSSASSSEEKSIWVSEISASKQPILSYLTRVRVPVPYINDRIISSSFGPSYRFSSVTSCPGLMSSYQAAELEKPAKPASYKYQVSHSPNEVSYIWHLPKHNSVDVSGGLDSSPVKGRTVVVLLGWLGAKQKHLKRYAEWYTSRGFHAITFTFPMSEILSYQVGGKAEQDVVLLGNHLADWLEDEDGKNLVFHTFSNTGWLTYGVILENLQRTDPTLMGRIKGCIVDSAPVAAPDPQVWASGFSAAFLKKHSIATKGLVNEQGAQLRENEPKTQLTETALLAVLRKLFEVVLNLPAVNRRLSDVLSLLTSQQPSCPQLYIYSSADRVIPAGAVESFIERQRKNGREVRSCDFISTPHVDHFRNDPKLYSSQLTGFLEDCVLNNGKNT